MHLKGNAELTPGNGYLMTIAADAVAKGEQLMNERADLNLNAKKTWV